MYGCDVLCLWVLLPGRGNANPLALLQLERVTDECVRSGSVVGIVDWLFSLCDLGFSSLTG